LQWVVVDSNSSSFLQLRRLITLVDALYESRSQVFMLAASDANTLLAVSTTDKSTAEDEVSLQIV